MSKATHRAVSITLTFDVVEAVDNFATLSGMTRSAVINDILSETLPTLNTVTQTLSEVKEMDEQQRQDMREKFSELEAQAKQIQETTSVVALNAYEAVKNRKLK